MQYERQIRFDYSELLGRLKKYRMTQGDLANAIGIREATLSLKLNNKAFFSQPEINKICEILDISKEDIGLYFFVQNVQETEQND